MIAETVVVTELTPVLTQALLGGLSVPIFFDWLEQANLSGFAGKRETEMRKWLDEHGLPSFGLARGKERI